MYGEKQNVSRINDRVLYEQKIGIDKAPIYATTRVIIIYCAYYKS